jgi:uncharacterized protein YuzE
MELRYDREADALYLKLREGRFARNRKVDSRTILDLDAEGNLLGIELLEVSGRVPSRELAELRVAGMHVAT